MQSGMKNLGKEEDRASTEGSTRSRMPAGTTLHIGAAQNLNEKRTTPR